MNGRKKDIISRLKEKQDKLIFDTFVSGVSVRDYLVVILNAGDTFSSVNIPAAFCYYKMALDYILQIRMENSYGYMRKITESMYNSINKQQARVAGLYCLKGLLCELKENSYDANAFFWLSHRIEQIYMDLNCKRKGIEFFILFFELLLGDESKYKEVLYAGRVLRHLYDSVDNSSELFDYLTGMLEKILARETKSKRDGFLVGLLEEIYYDISKKHSSLYYIGKKQIKEGSLENTLEKNFDLIFETTKLRRTQLKCIDLLVRGGTEIELNKGMKEDNDFNIRKLTEAIEEVKTILGFLTAQAT